mmetsp:Transcript_6559/g.13743  ORF Transcript_6559/g.13743 Transcript_6559/m.13743 type:complete len:103 (+) Transcript_6559:34-342(+)
MSSSSAQKRVFDHFVSVAAVTSPLRTGRVLNRARRQSQFAGSPVSTSETSIGGKTPPARWSSKRAVNSVKILLKRKSPRPQPLAPKPTSTYPNKSVCHRLHV